MNHAIETFRHVSAMPEFEARALLHAKRESYQEGLLESEHRKALKQPTTA